MKIHYKPFSNELNIAILLVRLYLGIRLVAGGILRLIDNERMQRFINLLDGEQIISPVFIAGCIFTVQVFIGISFITGWLTRWFACAALAIGIFLLISFSGARRYDIAMPPLAVLLVCSVFVVVSAGKYNIQYLRRAKAVQRKVNERKHKSSSA